MSGIATVQMAILAALAGDDVCLAGDDLVVTVAASPSSVWRSVERLMVRGLIERVEAGCIRLSAAGRAFRAEGGVLLCGPLGPEAGRRRPRKDTFRQRAWRAMALERTFTVDRILMLAGRPGHENISSLRTFLKGLVATGYVIELGRLRRSGPGPAVIQYQLVRLTGPIAPTMKGQRGHALLDHNTGETIPMPQSIIPEAS